MNLFEIVHFSKLKYACTVILAKGTMMAQYSNIYAPLAIWKRHTSSERWVTLRSIKGAYGGA